MRNICLSIIFCCIGFAASAYSTLGGGGTASSNVCAPTTNTIIYHFHIDQSAADANLDSLRITTAGTYTSTDINNLRLWYNTSDNIGTAINIATDITSLGAGLHSFTGAGSTALSAPLPSSGTPTTYYWITVDVPATVTAGNTISVNNILPANISVSTGGTSGIATAGGSQTLNIMPSAIYTTAPSGFFICQSSSIPVFDLTLGGSWVSSNPTIASFFAGSVIGNLPGIATISYTVAGCTTTQAVTVNSTIPAIDPPTSISVCVGGTVTVSDDVCGGNWSSSTTDAFMSTSGACSGVIHGVSAGTPTISYNVSGCISIVTITVNALPSPITGPSRICAYDENDSIYSDTDAPGIWSSTGATIVGSTTGTSVVVSGMAPGVSTICYSTGSGGCTTCKTVTVVAWPLPITGTDTVCATSTTTLTDPSGGGVWSSSLTGIATIGNLSGIVFGIDSGTTIITYTALDTTHCYNTVPVYVHPFDSISHPLPPICIGVPTTITDAVGGGVWSISSGIATIGPSTGIIIGSTAGVAMLTYTISAHGCVTEYPVTVNANPASITGLSSVCVNQTISLTDVSTPGTWSSSNTAITDIDTLAGVDTGISAGTAIITFTNDATGCIATKTITVNGIPSIISGPSQVCLGSSVTLTESSTGGTWSESNTNATISTISPGLLVTGFAVGTDIISYTFTSSGCPTIHIITVNPLPSGIAGVLNICSTYSTTLTDASPGGLWSSSNLSVATIDPHTGVAIGGSSGTTVITYRDSVTDCTATATLTVNALPAVILASGDIPQVCVGFTLSLSDATSGGTWSSLHTPIATIDPSGVVTGVSAGTDSILYTISYAGGTTMCPSVIVVTVNPLPAPIVSTSFGMCVGDTRTFTDATTGGTWSSSDISIASVSPSGIVTGVSTGVSTLYGVATITYTSASPESCPVTHGVTVYALPAPITGVTSICYGTTTTVHDITPGGTWHSSNPTVASIGSTSGIINGIDSGVAIITYLTATGCMATISFTVNPIPTPIYASTYIGCGGGLGPTFDLKDTSLGGTWVSVDGSVAVITPTDDTTGTVLGYNGGTDTIKYVYSTGCYVYAVVTINPSPIFTGPTDACEGSTITLVGEPAGGTWFNITTSGIMNLLIPIVPTDTSMYAVIYCISTGTVNVGYSLNGCASFQNVSIWPTPGSISGPTSVCVGSSITLSDLSMGGSWGAYNGSATVDPLFGVVTGLTAGVDTITYSYSPAGGSGVSCFASYVVTVNPVASITGNLNLCIGQHTTLNDTTLGGGTWSSGDNLIATVTPVFGFPDYGDVYGVGAGIVPITFTTTIGACNAIANVSVNPNPTISGGNGVCLGGTLSLTADFSPGTWTSSLPTIADVGLYTGVVTGISLGSAIITYITDAGCSSTQVVTVNNVTPVVGPTEICLGVPALYTNSIGSGTWTSSDPVNMVINSVTGVATGFLAGTYIISYTNPSGCTSTLTVTVLSVSAISPAFPQVCVGSDIMLTDATTGGVWSSANTSIATIDPFSGMAHGVASGTVTISYTVSSGCYALVSLVVNPNTPIIGQDTVCRFLTTNLSNATSCGIWSSLDVSIATVSSTGTVTGINCGSTTIYYTTCDGCTSAQPMTVLCVDDITNAFLSHIVCTGNTLTLVDTGTGTWTSSAGLIASVGFTTGIVFGNAIGTANITYTVPTYGFSCIAMYPVTVEPTPAPILSDSGFVLCAWATDTIPVTDATMGGTWSSTFAIITDVTGPGSTVDSAYVVGAGVGTGTITYSLGTGCYVTAVVTVNTNPLSIIGVTNVCVGQTITLSDGTTGGNYTSSNTGIATVNTIPPNTGVVTGVTAGTAVITYMLPGLAHCFVTKLINVLADSPIVGPNHICVGEPILFHDGMPGGTWSVSSTTIATLSPTTGANTLVTGITSPGIATISYTTTSCVNRLIVTVNPLPPPIGYTTLSVCATQTISLTESITTGKWSTKTPTIATIDQTGSLYGVWSGVDSVLYTDTITGCYSSVTVTVNPFGQIKPHYDTICQGVPTTLSDTVAGGVWSPAISADYVLFDIGGGQAVIIGFTSGASDVITYSIGSTGCTAVITLNTEPQPAAISGFNSVCVGSQITLTSFPDGGIDWTSSSTPIATVNGVVVGGLPEGIVTGVSAGTAIITYKYHPGGCYSTYPITVDALPTPIFAASHNLCGTDSMQMHDTTLSGTWSCSPTTIATINPVTGKLYAIGTTTGGTVIITYSMPPSGSGIGCEVTYVVTVNPLELIVGPSHICNGVPTLFTDAVGGGVWSSVFPSIASVTTSISGGTVTGHLNSTDTIYYTISGTGCRTFILITVNPIPGIISGPAYVCQEQCVTMTDATPGGTWSSHDPTRATIDPVTGILCGINTGTVIISYTFGTGCYRITTIVVDPLTPTFTAPGYTTSFCYGDYTNLINYTPGGVWSSSNNAIASVNPIAISFPPYSAGHVVGTSNLGGTVTISYTLPTGCVATFVVTVNPHPSHIIVPSWVAHPAPNRYNICKGDSLDLTDAYTGGLWWSSVTSVATINPITGHLNTFAPGAIYIHYTLPTMCDTFIQLVVEDNPDSITGLFNICIGASTTLDDEKPLPGTTAGGAWTSPGLGSIISILNLPPNLPIDWSREGVITGLAAGITTITFTMPGDAGCKIWHLFEVSAIVSPTITLHSSIGDTSVPGLDKICTGQVPNFWFTTTHEGMGPTFSWYKNSTLVGSGMTYTYSPVVNGDKVKVTMVSDAICTTPATVSDSLTMQVLNNIADSIHITSTADATQDTVCEGTSVKYTALTFGGGSSPKYQWQINSTNVLGATNITYTYVPSAFDHVGCYLISSNPCADPDTAFSNIIIMKVRPALHDTIRIIPNVTTVKYYDSVSFYTESVNFGWSATYQWYVNGTLIPGATDSTFTVVTSPADGPGVSIYCIMVSSNPCTTSIPDTSNTVIITISNVDVPYVANGFNDVKLSPNPNKGSFKLKGFLNTVLTDNVDIEITDILGKVVYRGTTLARNGKVNTEITLDSGIPPGVYYLRLTQAGESDLRHFVIEK